MGSGERARPAARDDARERRRRRTITLAIALGLLALALVAALSHASERRIITNDMPAYASLGTATEGDTICQDDELIPSGTAALRIGLDGDRTQAPPVQVTVSSGGAVLASGGAGARWDEHETIFVPLAPALRENVTGTVCVALVPGPGTPERYKLRGWILTRLPRVTIDGRATSGRIHLEYLAAGTRSWWSFASTVVHRLDRGHAWSGPSVVVLLALLMITPIALGAWQLTRDPEG